MFGKSAHNSKTRGTQRLLLTARERPRVRRGIGWMFGRRNPFTLLFGA